ncbi:metallophosphoesterase family protein [Natronosalvus amylolyticus]|uniref:metallophosphoesterase family protein n=1 Tax=Natronosalvus amylolyticus TaxID=2961994 RepID=UPI0020CA04D7|nr:metallophosphoesterase family protein [Natronosalvus amylolyticus]
MYVGILSDVHGNLPALEAVLEDMPAVDSVVCVGDVVGYNPWPAACVDRVMNIADDIVQGNHDRMVHTPHVYSNPLARAGLEFAKRQLSHEQLRWLEQLPRKSTVAEDQFLLVHDHPNIQDRYVFPPEFETLTKYLEDRRGLILGHTHVQHAATIDDKLLINPGSVGQPRDDDPRAAYAVLDTDEQSVELRRTRYDVDAVISKVENTELPIEIGTRLLDGS